MKLVLKIGTRSVSSEEGSGINLRAIAGLVELVVQLKQLGHQVAVVSSGAIGLGSRRLGWYKKPSDITAKQAAASVGQVLLTKVYEDFFAHKDQAVGQVLLTRGGMQDRERYLNAQLTLRELLKLGVVPILNENDAISDDELKFGDNDYLAAVVSELIGADHLFILSDIAGLYTGDPHTDPSAELIPTVKRIDYRIELLGGVKGSEWSTGGMGSKLEAAKMATAFGTKVHILSSQNPLDVIGSLAGQQHGTTFLPSSNPVEARKAWIAYAVPPQGKLLIDRGALEALCKGKSLLPVGILRVSGSFRRGNAVEVFFEDHHQKRLVARGICKYSSGEIAHIMGHMSSEIEDLLGYSYGNSVIHRDDMALLSSND